MKQAYDVSLREYIERILEETEKRNNQRFNAQERAIETASAATKEASAAALTAVKDSGAKAEAAIEKRLEGTNEWQRKFADTEKTYIRGDVAEARFKGMEVQIAALTSQLTETKGRGAGRNDIWIILVVVSGFIVSVTALFIHH